MYFYLLLFEEAKKLDFMRMKTYQGQWRLSQTGSGLHQHLLTRRSPHQVSAKPKKAVTELDTLTMHIPTVFPSSPS